MIALIITLTIVGFLLYLIQTYVPMAQPFKLVIYVIVVIVLILYLMRVFGIHDIPLR